jgi:hypothetical protein
LNRRWYFVFASLDILQHELGQLGVFERLDGLEVGVAGSGCLNGYFGLFGEVDAGLDRVEELGLGLLFFFGDVALASFATIASFGWFVAASESSWFAVSACAKASTASFAEGFTLASALTSVVIILTTTESATATTESAASFAVAFASVSVAKSAASALAFAINIFVEFNLKLF